MNNQERNALKVYNDCCVRIKCGVLKRFVALFQGSNTFSIFLTIIKEHENIIRIC
jgi:hypothetical protein